MSYIPMVPRDLICLDTHPHTSFCPESSVLYRVLHAQSKIHAYYCCNRMEQNGRQTIVATELFLGRKILYLPREFEVIGVDRRWVHYYFCSKPFQYRSEPVPCLRMKKLTMEKKRTSQKIIINNGDSLYKPFRVAIFHSSSARFFVFMEKI